MSSIAQRAFAERDKQIVDCRRHDIAQFVPLSLCPCAPCVTGLYHYPQYGLIVNHTARTLSSPRHARLPPKRSTRTATRRAARRLSPRHDSLTRISSVRWSTCPSLALTVLRAHGRNGALAVLNFHVPSWIRQCWFQYVLVQHSERFMCPRICLESKSIRITIRSLTPPLAKPDNLPRRNPL